MTGARVFIPWFGSSILVWSNVIGVTLAAVAVGNLVGGRLADRRPRAALLALLLGAAGVLAAAVPYVVPWLAGRYLPEGLGLDVSFALLGRASLLVAILSLGPPLLLLGAATPFLVRGATRDGRVGRAAGLVSGTATLGSLVGTWLPVHLLVPSIGSARTCAVAGGAVAAAGLVCWLATRRRIDRRVGAGVLLAPLAAAGLGLAHEGGVGRPVPEGTEVLAELETRYQYARVERLDDRTILRLNEGLDSFHSMTVDGELLTGAYFDQYGLFLPESAPDGTIDVAVLGHAAGTIARQLLALDPERRLRVTGVEIDPAVAALGPRWFDLPDDERLEVVTGQDARVFLDRTTARFDLLVVDTYVHQVYVPFQTCSLEFFRAARDRLEPSGVLAANVGGFTVHDAPVAAIRDTAARVFGEVGLLRVSGGRNFVLVARKDAPLEDPSALRPPPPLEPLAEAAARPGAWLTFADDPAHDVLTDDRSDIEKLADRDLLEKSRLQLEGAR